MSIHVMIPAHNEEAHIGRALESLARQTRPPDRVTVIADNCTDGTVRVAREWGVEVFETVGNRHRKAGAQNQFLALLLPSLRDQDVIVSMDADVQLARGFISNATRTLRLQYAGAVSANHLVARHGNAVELLQAAEFERDRRYIGRKRGRVGCMSGMATAFRVEALREVALRHGTVYDEGNWTEDWKLTFALRRLGWKCLRPQDARCTTAPATGWREVFTQRVRWGRGYFQTLCEFGLNRTTAEPWLSTLWGSFQAVVWLAWTGVVVASAARGSFHLPPWFLGAMGVFILERVVTTRQAGFRATLLSALYLPDLAYGWWVLAATYTGIVKHLVGAGGRWGDVRLTGKATIS